MLWAWLTILVVALIAVGIFYSGTIAERAASIDTIDLFVDPIKPTEEELYAWAASGACAPTIDWAWLLTYDDTYRAIIEELAANPGVPNRKFFVFCKTLLDERER